MNEKFISIVLVAATSLGALFFMVKNNIDLAVFFLTLMFTFSNFFRWRSSKQQGLEKETKWMKKMTITFLILTCITLIISFV